MSSISIGRRLVDLFFEFFRRGLDGEIDIEEGLDFGIHYTSRLRQRVGRSMSSLHDFPALCYTNQCAESPESHLPEYSNS